MYARIRQGALLFLLAIAIFAILVGCAGEPQAEPDIDENAWFDIHDIIDDELAEEIPEVVETRRPWLVGFVVLYLVVLVLIVILYIRSRNTGKRLDNLVKKRTAELDISRQELSNALQDANSANRAKSEFLATMSHEIRTPINAIIGIAQIRLQKGSSSDEETFALERIYNSGHSLLGIINDLLDLSKVESGKLELNIQEYDMPSLINDSVQLNIIRIGARPLEFLLDVDASLPLRLLGDELRLKQILNNLLSNAFKYTENGYVKLSVSHKTHKTQEAAKTLDVVEAAEAANILDDGDIMLVFTVEDSGRGMRQENLDKLFSEYLRFDTAADQATEGTGLGLIITKRLVEIMDGTIEVWSEYGKGSIFKATVKQKSVGSPEIGAKMSDDLRTFSFVSEKHGSELNIIRETMPYGKVLVVDDVEMNTYVAKGLLSPYKLEIEIADSGFSAIEKVESGKSYDIIFMDYMMPGMDGMETAEKLREGGYDKPIVALTANALVGNEEMFKKQGFDGFISKPINLHYLNDTLNRFVRDRHPEAAGTGEQIEENEELSVSEDPELIRIFCDVAKKSIEILPNAHRSGDTKLLHLKIHGMKPALKKLGEDEAYTLALSLEKAAIDEDNDFIDANIERFIEIIEKLIKKLNTQNNTKENYKVSDNIIGAENEKEFAHIIEQLSHIKTACDNFDIKAAYRLLDILKEKSWKEDIATTLEQIHSALYLHSDFEKAAEQSTELIKRLSK